MRIKRTRIAVVLSVLLATTAAAAPAVAGPARPDNTCTPTWQVVATPAPPSPNTALKSVDVLSRRNVRMSGYSAGAGYRPWNLGSDGTTVTETTQIPAPGMLNMIAGKSAFSSPSDGWTIVSTRHGSADHQVVERWSHHRWTMTPLAAPPDPETMSAGVTDLGSVSSRDAWAVGGLYVAKKGTLGNSIPLGALIEHWDGRSWRTVPNPAGSRAGAALRGISVVSADDIWVAGFKTDDAGVVTPLAEHFDGTAWHVVDVPAGNKVSSFWSIQATADGQVWAVGLQTMVGDDSQAVAMVEHFDGTTWRLMNLPDLGNAKLDDVYVASANSVWAIVEVPEGANAFLHWNGTSWTRVPAPGPQEYGLRYFYQSIAGSGPDDIWAVGEVTDRSTLVTRPQIAHYSCGGR